MQTISHDNTPFGGAAYRATITVERDQVREARLVEEARAGSNIACEQLIELCQARAWMRAVRLARFYNDLRGVSLDPQDIAQEAVLRAWTRLDKALATPNPIGYLFRALEGAMLTFCRERQSAVRVPACMQSRGVLPVEVVSLNAPLSGYDQVTLADLLPAQYISSTV